MPGLFGKKTRRLLGALLILALLGAVTGVGGYLWLSARLPPITALTNYQPDTPLRIFAANGELIGEFGAEQRLPLPPEAVPEQAKEAFLAAEDASFFEHPGIDIMGIFRALIADIKAGAPVQGASTITQQVARTFLLTRERTIMRKLREMILAFRIERRLTKAEILHLYLNQIYLGNGAYGIEAAAQTYYGKSVHDLELAEMAMLGGLPKAPASYNPARHPERARERRDYVLRRMRETGMAEPEAVQKALETPIHAGSHDPVSAPLPGVAEEVRRRIVTRHGKEKAYTGGFRVFTAINPELQKAARKAVQRGLLDYTYRHGYRGPEAQWDLASLKARAGPEQGLRKTLMERLAEKDRVGPLRPGVVVAVSERSARVLLTNGETIELGWNGIEWARAFRTPRSQGPQPGRADEVVARGDVIRLDRPGSHWKLSQIPEVQGSLVAMDPASGRIRAMVGSFHPSISQYNRAIQARRQPGSAFKPFLYAAGLNQGLTPATLINDSPLVFEDEALETRWRPENYSEEFYGPTRLRKGLEKSRNLVTIRLVRRIGVDYARDFATRFGFNQDRLPDNLSLSLGSASLPPVQMVKGFATFANGGRKVDPILIQRVEGRLGHPMKRNTARSQCIQCHRTPNADTSDKDAADLVAHPELRFHPAIRPERAISPQINHQMVSLLRGVVQRGTGWRAKHGLDRPVAGKTGTSNDQRDAWFLGFSPELVAGVYVGYDQPQTLGSNETGSRAAAPIWVDFMQQALADRPVQDFEQPEGLVTVRIDADTGKLAAPWSEDTLFEVFREGNAPSEQTPQPAPSGDTGDKDDGEKGSATSRPDEDDASGSGGTEGLF